MRAGVSAVPSTGRGMAESDILCQDNYGQFKDWLLRYHKQITEHFHESCVAAEQYYRKVCRGHRNICVVDLGWHGKSIVYLKYFMERKCAMDVRVTGAMIAPVTMWSHRTISGKA